MFGDIENFRQSGILVTAQRRIDHVIGNDARFLRVIPDCPKRVLRQCLRFVGAEANTVAG
jgi:hypothetical protein